MKHLLLFAALLLAGATARAQSLPVLDQNPPTVQWQQVNTPHFRVIFPAGMDTAAQRTAQRLETIHAAEGRSLGVSARPIAVVLQNQTTVSNGFVTFLPRHAEFFTTPEQGQSLGTVDWLDQLAVHEFRHVNQFDKARQGVGRVLGPLLGDGALGVAAVGVPQWFFEGDAVGTETAFTRSGRGRIPNFNVGLRANLLEGRLYNYQKAVNGSLRDNVPNWYVLGYFMTSYAKAHYGADVWDKALNRYFAFPFYPFSFSNGVRRTTGLRVEGLYARTMHELDSAWRAEQAARPAPTPVRELAGQADPRIFTEYQYPQYLTDSTVLALKTGLDNIPQLVLLGRHGRERKVYTLGLFNSPEMLSVAAGKAVWPEFQPDARWGRRFFSELKVLDLATGKLTRVGRRGRFAAAALSADGRRLVAVRTDASYHHALVLLDARSGQELQTLPNPRNNFYQQPRFTASGQVVVVALSAAGKTIQLLDPTTGQARNLLPWANVNLTNPQPWGEYVFYNSPQSGVDNIYAVSLVNGLTYQVTNSAFGAYHVAVSSDTQHLAFQDYRATGARVVEISLNQLTWLSTADSVGLEIYQISHIYGNGSHEANPDSHWARLFAPVITDKPGFYTTTLAAGETAGMPTARLLARPDSAAPRYGVRRYAPLAHAFRLAGYGAVQSPAGTGVAVGLRTQDFLNTTQFFAGLDYNQTERTAAATGLLSYQGRYPVLDVEATYGGRNTSLLYPDGSLHRDEWQYARFSTGLRLPLTLTHSRYLQALTLGAYYVHEQVFGYDLQFRSRTEVGATTPLHAVLNYLSYVNQLKQSARDMAPRGGGALLLISRTTPFATRLQATQLGAQASVYLPGLARHHALRLRGGYQYQQQAQYNFSAAIAYPRGETTYLSFDRLAVASADYSLPLAFVHWTLGRVLYVQRLRATAFADVARGTVGPYRQDFRNAGLDVWALFNVLHLRTPLEAGVRATYSSLRQQVLVEPLAFSVRL